MFRFLLPLLLLACNTGADSAVDADGDGWTSTYDCDDTDAGVYPNADELCDGVDQDCDGDIDEDATDATAWYADADADGFGDAATTVAACAAPDGYVADATDCDDTDAAFHPGADEADCTDPADYNCDGSVGYTDADGDGFAACADCDDADAAVSPDAVERCDGVDDDCDGVTDADASDAVTWYTDADGDGYGAAGEASTACEAPAGAVADDTDCDDTAATIHPGASEVCDGLDEDCDLAVDEDASDVSAWYADTDGDGFGAGVATMACAAPDGFVADATDCDDARADVNPAATEVCDGVDDNCDGAADDHDAGLDTSTRTTWSVDYDGDGYGDASGAYTWDACDAPGSDYVADTSDCDDDDAAISPAAAEVCDAADVDEDCDGAADDADVDADVMTMSAWYADVDADGYGAGAATFACDLPAGFSASDTDCADGDAAVHPGATEVCDALDTDEDCDGSVIARVPVYADGDGDGYGDELDPGALGCVGAAFSTDNTDCDDAEATVNPGETELCDGVDDDCDGEEFFSSDFSTAVPSAVLSINGDAVQDTTNGLLVLNTAIDDQRSSATLVQRVPASGWYASMDFEIHGGDGENGADGITLYFLDETDPTLYSTTGGGSGLSVYGLHGYAVEIDTFASTYDDFEGKHLALIDTYDMSEIAATALPDVQDGALHTLEVSFASGEVEAWLDGTEAFYATISGYTSTDVLVGVSSATGTFNDEHDVDALTVTCGG